MAVDDEETARVHAAEALRKYQEGSGSDDVSKFGRRRRMTQRFCSYTFAGDNETDIPLRPLVDQLLVHSI